jgi:superfamily I DNA/RNA helicase
VKVTNDFLFKMENARLVLDDDELRLLYVATTRAQHVLDVSALREELIRLLGSRPGNRRASCVAGRPTAARRTFVPQGQLTG